MAAALAPVVIVAGTAVSYVVAAAIGIPLLAPIVNTAPALPFMIASLRAGRVGEAIGRMLIWAAALAVCATTIGYLWTPEAGHLFIRGEDYRREMFAFVLTGAGNEGDIRRFLPMHAAHAAVFCVLALATGSLLAMPMGALLMNYMGYYVGALAAASAHPFRAMALAWVPWALIRIVGFVTLGVVLSGPVLRRAFHFEFDLRREVFWLRLALCFLIVDVLLKWALAPWWRHLIRAAAGW